MLVAIQNEIPLMYFLLINVLTAYLLLCDINSSEEFSTSFKAAFSGTEHVCCDLKHIKQLKLYYDRALIIQVD